MSVTATPFLMFEGRAEEALKHWESCIPGFAITRLERWGAAGPGQEGQLSQAAFTIGGREFRCFDSPPAHAFTFTPSISIFLDCTEETELERVFAALSDGGSVLMPLGAYGFSKRFGWVNDRFGVSWQINLP